MYGDIELRLFSDGWFFFGDGKAAERDTGGVLGRMVESDSYNSRRRLVSMMGG